MDYLHAPCASKEVSILVNLWLIFMMKHYGIDTIVANYLQVEFPMEDY